MSQTQAQQSLLGLRPGAPYIIGLGVAGLVMVLYFHHWSLTVTAIALILAWWSILATGYFLWTAGLFVAVEEDSSEGFNLFRSRADDLELEKQSLLKAIKEVEFDHLMGKMSDGDASALSALYRKRAVEILKQLDDVEEGDETLSIADRIERDIRTRAEISGARERGRARAEREAHRSKMRVEARASGKPAPKLGPDIEDRIDGDTQPEPEPEPQPRSEEEE